MKFGVGTHEDLMRHSTAIILVGLFALIAVVTRTTLQKVWQETARVALLAEVHKALLTYAIAQSNFPPSLKELTITNFPERSTEQTLALFEYQSSGTSFSLSCPSLYEKEPRVVRDRIR